MKLTAFIMTLACLQVAAKAFSQISISEKNVPLNEVITTIQNQSGYSFLYKHKLVEDINISTELHDVTLEQALDNILKGQPLTYEVIGKTVVLKKIEPSVLERIKNLLAIPVIVKGRVTDTTGMSLPKATVVNLKQQTSILTDNDGNFNIQAEIGDRIMISFVGYKPTILTVSNNMPFLNIVLHVVNKNLSEVIVNTGYQTLPKERATGSFDVISQKEIEQTTSSNLLDHLNGIASGVLFDGRSVGAVKRYNNLGRTETFSVRGISTINSNGAPLIVVDGFPFNSQSPYYQDINSLNPNDIASVTVLKDAAATSIWGARAGNGVIVITTKSGKYDQRPTITFNANVTVTSRPDLFSNRTLSTPDYISIERNLYSQGYYATYYNTYANPNASSSTSGKPVSDVIGLLFQVQTGSLTQAQADAKIAALSQLDVRNDIKKYLYQNGVDQQYHINVSGGATQNKYYLSVGYDNNNGVDRSYQKRLTITTNNVFKPVKNLELSMPITISNNDEGSDFGNPTAVLNGVISPYAQLTDANGNPQNVTYSQGYSPYFIQKAISKGLYDVSYNPINQFNAPQYNHVNTTLLTITPTVHYSLPIGISADITYQYSKTLKDNKTYQSDSLFTISNTINNYTQISSTGALTYPINKGGQYTIRDDQQVNNNIRAVLSYNHFFGRDHRVDALAGYERNESTITSNYNGWYGYNAQTGSFQTIMDNVTNFTLQNYALSNSPFSITSPTSPLQNGIVNQFTAFISSFANGAYTYKDRYIVSGSARIDQANLFGVNTDDKKKALWSTGLAWRVNKEDFYKLDWLPELKLRFTYGYQGNVPSITVRSLTTINYNNATTNSSGLPYATLNNVPNPNLRWENVGQANLGLDFGTKNNIFSGSIEYYTKKANDLIAPYSVDPTTGITTKTGNIANITGNGLDITLNSRIIHTKKVEWNSRVLFSHNTDKLTNYFVTATASSIVSVQATSSYPNSGLPTPVVGNAVYGVYSYKWGGLDKAGNPQGYDANGNLSEDYNTILNNTSLTNLVYSGSANPTYYGSFMNSVSYKNVSVSFNITYKAGYYFHAQSVNYAQLTGSNMLSTANGSSDYSNRWQNPGDELTTYVPSWPTQANNTTARANFYQYSSVLVQKGDNVRLKDVNLSYTIQSLPLIHNSPFKTFEIYAYYFPDLLLWKATKMDIDPDYSALKPVSNISFGIRTTFK